MVKLIDIAEQLSLSRITVSAVLNDRYKSLGISEATAQRVMRTAEEMGYRRNQLAMAIKTGRTYSFGIMIGADYVHDWMGQTLKSAYNVVHPTDYTIKVDFVGAEGGEIDSLNRFLGQRVEGLFGLNLHPSAEDRVVFRESAEKYGIPMICSNSAPELCGCKVESNNAEGSRLALNHLVELGHTRIAYIGGANVTEAGIRRQEGFLAAVEEHGLTLEPGYLQRCDWEVPKAEAAAENLLADPKKAPTAIICANDIMAVVVIRRARKLGIQVPKDLSIIGFSNEILTQMSDPPLTVVDVHHEIIGETAMQSLLDHAERKNRSDAMPAGTNIVPTRLITRESTAPPRAT